LGTSPASAQLHLIDLDQQLPGQRRFISCWVSLAADLAFIVDPGPPSTADYLISELEKLGVENLDFILLTHVHLDHGGCTARVLERWPGARVVCHEKGRPHIVDPTRLWAGSQQVLGEKAAVYGEPAPVPAKSLAEFAEIEARGIKVVDTPGHAAHHLAFVHGDRIFLGECAGTFSALGQGPQNEEYYLRPATPPRLHLETAAASLDRVLALSPLPRRLLFAHHGEFAGDTRGLLESARRQLRQWTATVAEVRASLAALPHTEQPEGEAGLMALLRAALREVDPHYARGALLPPDIQERERDFCRQTLRGILGYLKDN
jgi:glyoxylase-like metal-dependent hydrolase (beta-lactamase superfamily II)